MAELATPAPGGWVILFDEFRPYPIGRVMEGRKS
jgi:hypothetical protein